jgi:preprotein translocase subunit SecF
MAISVLQDRKFLVHVSVELVLVGSMAYFFHHRSKTLEERVKKVEEELITLTDMLQQELTTIKKEMKGDKSNPELQKLYQENSLLRQQMQRQQLSANQAIQQLQQQYQQQLRQMKEDQGKDESKDQSRDIGKDVGKDQSRDIGKDESRDLYNNEEQHNMIEIFSITMPPKSNSSNASIELIDSESEIDLDEELIEELKELNQ